MFAIKMYLKGPQYNRIPCYYDGKTITDHPVWFKDYIDVVYLINKYIYKNDYEILIVKK